MVNRYGSGVLNYGGVLSRYGSVLHRPGYVLFRYGCTMDRYPCIAARHWIVVPPALAVPHRDWSAVYRPRCGASPNLAAALRHGGVLPHIGPCVSATGAWASGTGALPPVAQWWRRYGA